MSKDEKKRAQVAYEIMTKRLFLNLHSQHWSLARGIQKYPLDVSLALLFPSVEQVVQKIIFFYEPCHII